MKNSLITLVLCCAMQLSYAQRVAINNTGEAPDNSAILDVKSTSTGMLIPRMTSQERGLIASPATGLLVYDITTNSFWFKNATAWAELGGSAGNNAWTANGNNIYKTTAGNVGIGTNAPLQPLTIKTLSGDYGFAHTNDTVTLASKIGVPVAEDPAYPPPAGGWLGTKTNHPFYIYTNNGNRQVAFTPDFITEFRGTTPSLYMYDAKNFAGRLSANYRSLTLNAASYNPFQTGTEADPGTLYLQYGDYFRNGNVAIGASSADFKVTIGDDKLSGNQTLLLKLKGRNPVMTFEDGSLRYGYITAKSQTPPAGYTKGLVIGAEAGYPLMFSTNNYSLSMIIANNGNVGIGTANPTYKLSVNGNVRSKEVVVESAWADYVFEKDYQLTSLKETEEFILANKHLPGIPSAKEIQENGLALGDVQKKMMGKIEELTLHLIALEKELALVKNKL